MRITSKIAAQKGQRPDFRSCTRVLPMGGIATILGLINTISTVAMGATCYLASVGPPALHFDSVDQRGEIVPTEFNYNESKPPVSTGPAATVVARAQDTEPMDAGKTVGPASATNSVSEIPGTISGNGESGGSSEPSVSNISIVTPQMVVEYLKPVGANGGNGKGDAVLIPVKITFTPPQPVEQKSSTAVYKRE